jgi:hypothetical protein
MDPVDEFRKHADECRRSAQLAKDRASREHWKLLAQRWQRCIEVAESKIAATRNGYCNRIQKMKSLTGRS